MFVEYLRIVTAGLALFLVGANVAFLLHLGESLVSWFNFKIAAATLLLVYVSLSVLVGGPPPWRISIALFALIIDAIAVYRLWANVLLLVGGHVEVIKLPSND